MVSRRVVCARSKPNVMIYPPSALAPNLRHAICLPALSNAVQVVCLGTGPDRPVSQAYTVWFKPNQTKRSQRGRPDIPGECFKGTCMARVYSLVRHPIHQQSATYSVAKIGHFLTGWPHAGSVPTTALTPPFIAHKYAVRSTHKPPRVSVYPPWMRTNTVPSSISPTRHKTSGVLHNASLAGVHGFPKGSSPAVASVTLAPDKPHVVPVRAQPPGRHGMHGRSGSFALSKPLLACPNRYHRLYCMMRSSLVP